MHTWKQLTGPMRLPFLILTPASVALGWAAAVWTHGGADLRLLLIVLIGALAAHISVNAFNEYFDFKSGLDAATQRTPFSGGSGVLPAQPELAMPTLGIALTALALVLISGGYFLVVRGIGLLPIGLIGVLIILLYTPWINRWPLPCLIAPGLGFGPLMVVGTYYVLTGEYSLTAFAVSAVPFFLVNGLLLLNQFPDVDADRRAGRRNFPILIGRETSSLIYGGLLLLAFVSLVAAVQIGLVPRAGLAGLLGAIIAVPAFIGAYRHAVDTERLIPYMALNVATTIVTPLLISVGLLLA